jgi:metal-dependent amidase/aminoacylase/carboxypeptidase family protein
MIPESGVDANFIGCSLVAQLYSLKLTKISPQERGLLCVTKVQGGEGLAIISDHLKITGTLRMLSSQAQLKMREEIKKLSINFCQSFGA